MANGSGPNNDPAAYAAASCDTVPIADTADDDSSHSMFMSSSSSSSSSLSSISPPA
eukprot:CAMPEP_0171326544 /NCGR_PEP_ID=MMETSP0816-20121228/117525_1 /TAXON_ID=420281 /ORGANISM="Proboscia inermis, Strain CCAP1064/1" /LENGTH=55 /DNA_ID=CAMNT_0011826045 /DNA_START=737 /DNA_END=904 /DNA_ORIENTATION=+